MKPYGPFAACGRESCRLCNPLPAKKEEGDLAVVILAAAMVVVAVIVTILLFVPLDYQP
jgi:hypothetical protein